MIDDNALKNAIVKTDDQIKSLEYSINPCTPYEIRVFMIQVLKNQKMIMEHLDLPERMFNSSWNQIRRARKIQETSTGNP